MGWGGKLKALFFRENSPALTYADKLIIDELVRAPQTASELLKSLSGKMSRRRVFEHLDSLEKAGIAKKKGDYYHGGPVVELEARNTVLGLIAIAEFLSGIFLNNIALMAFGTFSLLFASSRKIRYEKRPKSPKKPVRS